MTSPAGPRIRIVIADDHPVFREGLKRLLQAESDFEIVGTANDGAEALRRVVDLQPDVLLLDLAMRGTEGLYALRAIDERRLAVRTVILTAAISRDDTFEAVRLGARGIVLKDAATSLLSQCIRGVVAGESWVGHEHVRDILEALREHGRRPADGSLPVTSRERLIMAAVARGLTNKDIALQIGASEQTVKNHLSRIFEKLGVEGRLELALYVTNHRLFD